VQVNFDLDEFIAYILNGGLVLVALNGLIPIDVITQLDTFFPADAGASAVGKTVLIAALSLLAGHISSVFARRVLRPLIRRMSKASRLKPWENGHWKKGGSAFWTEELCKNLQTAFVQAFPSLTVEGSKLAAPRLVRSFVIQRSSAVRETREHIVRARSLCANAILPLGLFVGLAVQGDTFVIAGLLVAAICVLISKQTDLDHREWKEIYTGFLALDGTVLSVGDKPAS
jgi:hypothetical protein